MSDSSSNSSDQPGEHTDSQPVVPSNAIESSPKEATISADSLATRLEGRKVKQPDPREYARYDRQKDASVRIQMITERLSAAKDRSPITKSLRNIAESHSVAHPMRTPEEMAAAAASLTMSRFGSGGVSSTGSNLSSADGHTASRELSAVTSSTEESDDSMVTLTMKAAMTGCDMQYIRLLGRGTYGQVVLANCDHRLKAVKLIEIDAHEMRFLRKVLRRELHVQSHILAHPFLMPIERVMRYGRVILMTMPFAANGDLYEYIRKRGYLNEQSACRLFYQLCRGVEHLHLNGYAHRDLKCENVLLDANLDIKLTDFGFTCALKPVARTPELSTLMAELSHSNLQMIPIWSLNEVRKRQELELAAGIIRPTAMEESEPSSPEPAAKVSGHEYGAGIESSRTVAQQSSSSSSPSQAAAAKSAAKGRSQPTKAAASKAVQPLPAPSEIQPHPLPADTSSTTLPPSLAELESPATTDSTSSGKNPSDLITVYRKVDIGEEERKRLKHTRIISDDNEVQFTQTHCGSLLYACPELLNRELYDPRLADVWSLGVILWVMLFNCYPYEDRRTAVLALAANTCVFEIPYRPPVSNSCKLLLRKMLVKEDFRLRLGEVLESEWISNNKQGFRQGIQTVDSGGIESRPSLQYRQNTGTFDV